MFSQRLMFLLLFGFVATVTAKHLNAAPPPPQPVQCRAMSNGNIACYDPITGITDFRSPTDTLPKNPVWRGPCRFAGDPGPMIPAPGIGSSFILTGTPMPSPCPYGKDPDTGKLVPIQRGPGALFKECVDNIANFVIYCTEPGIPGWDSTQPVDGNYPPGTKLPF